jgi:hypothetical protein
VVDKGRVISGALIVIAPSLREGWGGSFFSLPSKLIGRFSVIFVSHVCQMLAIASRRSVKKFPNFGALRIARKSSDA